MDDQVCKDTDRKAKLSRYLFSLTAFAPACYTAAAAAWIFYDSPFVAICLCTAGLVLFVQLRLLLYWMPPSTEFTEVKFTKVERAMVQDLDIYMIAYFLPYCLTSIPYPSIYPIVILVFTLAMALMFQGCNNPVAILFGYDWWYVEDEEAGNYYCLAPWPLEPSSSELGNEGYICHSLGGESRLASAVVICPGDV